VRAALAGKRAGGQLVAPLSRARRRATAHALAAAKGGEGLKQAPLL